MRSLSRNWPVLLLLLPWPVGGCRPEAPLVVTDFAVTRVNWDTLSVAVSFGEKRLFGTPTPVEPDTVDVLVFDAAFDTLYAGPGPRVPLPDRELGNAERIMVETCGRRAGDRVCEQATLTASPKRVQAFPELDYPEDDQFVRGHYRLRYVVERARYGDGETWERIRRRKPLRGRLRAFVATDAGAATEVPLPRSRGRFDLARSDNYRDFRYALETRLLEHQEAEVRFEVVTDLGVALVDQEAMRRYVSRKTDEERMVEVAAFTQQAGAQILDALGAARHRRQAYVFINDWSYVPGTRQYRIEMELHWQTSFFGGWNEVVGRLTVGLDGDHPAFRVLREEATRSWRRRRSVEGDSLLLMPLTPLPQGQHVKGSLNRPGRDRRPGW